MVSRLKMHYRLARLVLPERRSDPSMHAIQNLCAAEGSVSRVNLLFESGK
jgi:hypothetical protein